MGDGGLAVGCAILSYNKSKKFIARNTSTMFLGPEYSDRNILYELKK